MKAVLALLLVISSVACIDAQQNPSEVLARKGVFTGELQLSPVGDGINMRVILPISYDDGAGHRIDVPASFETDGASIPRALWSIVGSPFSGGNYVEAAVIHDEGCVSHQYSWEITHMMFYTAMLDSGVSEHQAKLLYYGVRIGGPKWVTVRMTAGGGKSRKGSREEVVTLKSSPLTSAQVTAMDKKLTEGEARGTPLSIEQIDEQSPFDDHP